MFIKRDIFLGPAIIDPNGGDKICEFVIPPKTTSMAQALDSYFFRQHKEIARRMYERVALGKLNINL